MFDYNKIPENMPGEVFTLKTELEKRFPIFFGYEIEDQLNDYLDNLYSCDPFDRIFLFTDTVVLDFWGENLFQSIKTIYPNTQLYLLPTGEKVKQFVKLGAICEKLLVSGVTKRSLLISLGGGSIGNIVGLAAGLIFRGIRFIEIPTTMTHQTDGILSNKQAVNSTHGKNHFGMYHAPVFAWVDTRYLETEPPELKKAGIIEGIKNALIDQPEFIPYLMTLLNKECVYGPRELTDLCYKIIVSKNRILKKDPTEKNYATILEYGHTFAHAIEWIARGELHHGEAVSLGIKLAAHLSARLGYMNEDLIKLHYYLIDKKLGLTPTLPATVTAESVFRAMSMDNKKTGRPIRYVLLEDKGSCVRGEENDFLVKADNKTVQTLLHEIFETMQ